MALLGGGGGGGSATAQVPKGMDSYTYALWLQQQNLAKGIQGPPPLVIPTSGNTAQHTTQLQQAATAAGDPNFLQTHPSIPGSNLTVDQVKNMVSSGGLGSNLSIFDKLGNGLKSIVNKVSQAAGSAPQGMSDLDALKMFLANQGYSPGSPGGSTLVQTGPGLNQIISMLGLNNYTPPTLADLQKQAQNQTDLLINPQEDAIRRLIDQLNSSTANQISSLNAKGAAEKSDIQDTFDGLKAFTDAATAAGLARYDTTAQGVNAGNQQTLTALDRNQANARQAVDTELSRLGLNGQGSTLDTTRLDTDANFLRGLAEANMINAANNIAQEKANYGGVQNLLSQGQQQAGSQALAKVSQQLVQDLANIQAAQSSGLGNFNSQIQSLEGQKAAQTQANLAALQKAVQDEEARRQALLLQAISTANSGMHSVSYGGTPASGISPQQMFGDLLNLKKLQDSEAANSTKGMTDFQKAVQMAGGNNDLVNLLYGNLGTAVQSSLNGSNLNINNIGKLLQNANIPNTPTNQKTFAQMILALQGHA